ncbi:alpha/beta fold hydrolase [Photobacterium rosenbergii]|uniref:alpha/beta fold hydrolase n=1 Tax=Photobacterium rosenbergii TaxID=294936 RepID=UPI001C99A311|nr:alpha/beta fold hydrolase [Photobacterium rosenbergii]MBY5946774.1 alpha/beta hydrolase [Photobacterium rosenbergii]
MKPKHSLITLSLIGLLTACSSQPEVTDNSDVVVLAHGLARSSHAMWKMKDNLEQAGFAVCTIDYSTIGVALDDMLDDTRQQIKGCISRGGRTHFIGHSLGGLVIRDYLAQHPVDAQQLGKVIFMGTPNQGSEVADHMQDNFLMGIGGEVSQSLISGEKSLGNQLPVPDYPVGIIAGTKSSFATKSYFEVANDGLVSVDSAKVASMDDFIALKVSHTAMRYSQSVSDQAIHYLKHGQFDHTGSLR